MLLHRLGSRNGRIFSLVDGRGCDSVSYGFVLSLVDVRGCNSVVSELRVAALGLDGPS